MFIRSALIALTCTALAVPAMAQAKSATIQFADLDLSSTAGRATLDRRISTAARSVCASSFEAGSLTANARAERDCRAGVEGQAKGQVASQIAARTSATRL